MSDTGGTLLETPDGTETDKCTAEAVARLLNAFPAMSGALKSAACAMRHYEHLLNADCHKGYPYGRQAEEDAETALAIVGLTSHNTPDADKELAWRYSDPDRLVLGPDPLRGVR